MTDRDGVVELVGASSSATLDVAAQTLTFDHHGSVATDQQKALSPVVVPLGAIESVECTRGRSANWFWVVRRGSKPWRKGVWSDPCGVVSGNDPLEFVGQVKAAVAAAAPVTDAVRDVPAPPRRWTSKFAKGVGRAMVDGFFTTR